MSYNDLVYRDLESSLLVKKKLLESYSNFSEDKNKIRQKVLDLEAYKEDLTTKENSISRNSQLTTEEFVFLKEQIDFSQTEIMVKKDLLKRKINSYNSEIDSKHLMVQGKLKELRSKISVLKGKKTTQKFLIKEEFLNSFNLNYFRTNKSNLNVNSESEVLTLPLVEENKIKIGKIFISNESNCIPGNYTTGKNKFIYSIVDENQDTVFEAFKEGEGPLILDITLTFKRESVVNEFNIGQLNSKGSSSIEVDDIYYSDANNRTFALKQLIDTDYQKLDVLSSSNKQDLKITHLPVKAVQAKVVLKVKEYSTIENNSVFFLGLKSIMFKSLKYRSSGEISSNTFNVPENYFELSYEDKTFPRKKLTFNTEMQVSVDNGGVYEKVDENNLLLTSGRQKQLVYKYKLEKNLNAINKINELIDDNYFVDIEAESTVINKSISPSKYRLPFETTLRDSLRVVQSKILSRADSLSRRVKIGTIKNKGENAFVLETNLNSYDVNEINIYVNKNLCTFESEALSLDKTWSLGSDGKTIKVFIEETQPILEVSMLIKPLLPVIEKKPEGYYVRVKEKFDFDKNSLRVTCVTGLSDFKEEILSPGKKKYFLEETYLDSNSLKMEVHNGEDWLETTDLTINTLDGIIAKDTNLEEEVRVNYKYYKTKVLEAKQYEVWVKDNEVNGLYIYPEHISFEEKVDALGAENTSRYYLFDGTYSAARENVNSAKAFVLSSTNIIKGTLSISESLFDEDFIEVDYIDGFSEFLNIEKMQKDLVPNLEKNSLGEVQFSLQEIPYTEGVFGNEVKAFRGDGTPVGVRVVGRIATLTLNDNDVFSKDYYLKYYYQVEALSTEKYSVNYLEGILHTSKDVNPEDVTVNYKIGRLGLEYYIYNEIKNFEVDYENSNIAIRTEEFFEINNNLKFLAFKNKESISLEGLEDYFSPIVYNLQIGLN